MFGFVEFGEDFVVVFVVLVIVGSDVLVVDVVWY